MTMVTIAYIVISIQPFKIFIHKLKDKKFVQNGTALRINDVTSFDEGNFACSLNTIGYPKVNSPSARLYVESGFCTLN